MSKSKLVCTVELDLPDELHKAHELQAPLLSMWKQFTDALTEQGVVGARVDARVVKQKTAKEKTQTPLAAVLGTDAPQSEANKPKETKIPAFLKRD